MKPTQMDLSKGNKLGFAAVFLDFTKRALPKEASILTAKNNKNNLEINLQ